MAKTVKVVFELADGSVVVHQGLVGETLMDVALDNDVTGIKAQCGGGCTCCTCHCYIGQGWTRALPLPHADEQEMLTYAWGRADNSRLACQVFLDSTLDGIQVRIPAQQA